MGNPRLPDLPIRSALPAPCRPGESADKSTGNLTGGPMILAPWLSALPPAQADLLSLLPVLDINGAVFDALEGVQPAPAAPPVIAALFCADPFLRVRDAAALLRAAGITGVANFPTIQVIDGTAARGFDSADLGAAREGEVLARLAAQGLTVTGFVLSAETGLRLLDQGASALVVHPGPASLDWRARAVAARGAEATLTTLRARSAVALRLYCPDGYGAELDGARALADGLVRVT